MMCAFVCVRKRKMPSFSIESPVECFQCTHTDVCLGTVPSTLKIMYMINGIARILSLK